MKLYFIGGEMKTWRTLMVEQNVPTIAISYVGLTRRIKHTDNWLLADNFPDFQEIFLDSGAYTLNRDDADFTVEQAKDLAASYMNYVSLNADRATLIAEFDAQILGSELLQQYRDDFYNGLPSEKFMPVWHSETGIEELERLASKYDVIGIRPSDELTAEFAPVLNGIARKFKTRLHGVGITGKSIMAQVDWDSVSSSSWTTPASYGETHVWSERDHDLHRYPKDYKSARKQHRTTFIDNGFDAAKIEADDRTELLKLSLWSWQKFTEYLSSNKSRIHGNPDSVQEPNSAVAVLDGDHTAASLVSEPRNTIPIPTISIGTRKSKDEDGTEFLESVTEIRSESMRACNTCFLREKCPGFKPNANCLYNIPIEVKTQTQMQDLQAGLIEMQAQRVMFMKMSEDIEGGYADPNLSSEMDRLQRMIKTKADAEREGFRMVVEGSAPSRGPGYFSQIFGTEAADKLQALPSPVMADNLIEDIIDPDIMDAELVS